MKVRLLSTTFGKVVTKWYDLPASVIENNDANLFNAVCTYLLQVSGYNSHLFESFDFEYKF